MSSYLELINQLEKHEQTYEKEMALNQDTCPLISELYFSDLKLLVEKWPTHLNLALKYFERLLSS